MKPRREFTDAEVRAEIARLRDEVGGVRALAREIGVSPSYVSDVLNGRRAPGPDFLRAVGIRKEVVVRYVADETGPNPTQEPPPMRRTTRLLPLALALLAAHAWLMPAPARADFILAPLPAGSEPVHFADQPPGDSVVGLDPVDGIAVTVSNNGGDPISSDVVVDVVSIHFSTGPEGNLSITFSRPVYGASFVFGGPSAILTAIGVNMLGPNWFGSSPTFTVGPLYGTPGDRVSVLATGRDAFDVISASSGNVGGVSDLRILARPAAVPEPGGLALMGAGGVMLAGLAWRRRRRQALA